MISLQPFSNILTHFPPGFIPCDTQLILSVHIPPCFSPARSRRCSPTVPILPGRWAWVLMKAPTMPHRNGCNTVFYLNYTWPNYVKLCKLSSTPDWQGLKQERMELLYGGAEQRCMSCPHPRGKPNSMKLGCPHTMMGELSTAVRQNPHLLLPTPKILPAVAH